jgi:hypothetical protein
MADTQKITDALKMLDHNNADHWTDDGLPRTSVVQKLAGDTTIKRGDIQAASPNFSRTPPTDADGVALMPGSGGGGIKESGGIDGGTVLAPKVTATADVTESATEGGEGEQMTEEEVRAILMQRVRAADAALAGAIANVAEAQRIVREAQKAATVARAEQQSAFPPISASANIKQHLARQQDRLIAAHGGQPARIDQAMAVGNSRGWGRPTRQFVQPDGKVVTAGPRTQYSRKTPDLVNKRPAARV